MSKSLEVKGEGGVITKVEVKDTTTITIHVEQPPRAIPNLEAPTNRFLLTSWRISAVRYSDLVARMMGPNSIDDSTPREEFDMSIDDSVHRLIEKIKSARIPKEVLLRQTEQAYTQFQHGSASREVAESMAHALVNHCFPEE